MRRLWIERRKAAAAGTVAMMVYIEDPENGDTEINGVLCRELGALKNGKKARFAIGEEAGKVFVVAGKAGRDMHTAFVQLPEGEDDVFLSGRNYRNPFGGSSFRFDGEEGETVPENRKRGSGVGTAILVIAIVLGIVGGGAVGVLISRKLLRPEVPQVSAQVFSVEDMQITLTDGFVPMPGEGFTAGFCSDETVVYALRERFDAFEGFGELSLAGYGTMVLENNGLTDRVTLKEEGNSVSFEYLYTQEETGTDFYYYCVAQKGSDAFWLIQFAAPEEKQSLYEVVFPQWAQTVAID